MKEIPLKDLTDAYKAIHALRRFAEDHSDGISLVVRTAGSAVNPVALIHDTIQERFLEAWKMWGFKPFLHGDQVVYWCRHTNLPAFVDQVESDNLPATA